MIKRIISVIIAIVLCLSLTVAAHAESGTYIYDALGYLSEEQISELDSQCDEIMDDYGIGVYYAMSYDEESADAVAFAENKYDEMSSAEDGVIFVYTESKWFIKEYGCMVDVIDSETEDLIWDSFCEYDYFFDGIQDYIGQVSYYISQSNIQPLGSTPPVYDPTDEPVVGITANPDGQVATPPEGYDITDVTELPGYIPGIRLYDGAELLSVAQEALLLEKLNEISQRQGMDVIVATVNSIGSKTPMAFADDYYDYNGYDDNGILLLLSMKDRDWRISTKGFGITAFTDAGQEYMSERFVPYLSDGDYAGGFNAFADMCDSFITKAKEGKPYDSGSLPLEALSFTSTLIAIGVALLIAYFILKSMKSKLKSVQMKNQANDYVVPNSLQLINSRDIFLYSHVNRTLRPKDSGSGGGGSSTHSSSSGSSHGGSGGKF